MPARTFDELYDKDWLTDRYINKRLSAPKIAAEVGCSKYAVYRALNMHDLKVRKGTSKYWQLNDKEWLRRKYIDEQRSAKEIAEMVGSSVGNIKSALAILGVKTRNAKEALAVKYPDGRFGDKAANWKGGKVLNNGYIFVYAPDHPAATPDNPHVQEHRLVMEKVLGRYLREDEVVHHRDGDRQNNDPDNLEVKSRAQHVSDHFKASHEVLEVRQRCAELQTENAQLRAEIERLKNG
jgi:hypothetical protein